MSREKQNLPRRRMFPARRCSKWRVLSTPLPRPRISEMQEVPSGRKHRITSQILQNLHYASLCRYSRLLKFVPVGTGNRWKQSTKDNKSISNEFKCTWCHGTAKNVVEFTDRRLTRSGPLCETTHQRHAKASTCHVQQILWDDFLDTFWVFEQETFLFCKKFGNRFVVSSVCGRFEFLLRAHSIGARRIRFGARSNRYDWSRLISIDLDWYRLVSIDSSSIRNPVNGEDPACKGASKARENAEQKWQAKLLSPDHQSRCTLVFTPWHLFHLG